MRTNSLHCQELADLPRRLLSARYLLVIAMPGTRRNEMLPAGLSSCFIIVSNSFTWQEASRPILNSVAWQAAQQHSQKFALLINTMRCHVLYWNATMSGVR